MRKIHVVGKVVGWPKSWRNFRISLSVLNCVLSVEICYCNDVMIFGMKRMDVGWKFIMTEIITLELSIDIGVLMLE